jgi:hypothetical protein
MSRAARLALSATAWIALGAATFVLFVTEQKITDRRAALRTFDLHAREAAVGLADARAGQQAYVAAGQSSGYWIPKVATTVQDVSATVDALRATAVSTSAGQALLDASSAITEFGNIDKRVRDYLVADESLMASDVVFSEGAVAAARAAMQVERARLDEHQAVDADEAVLRRNDAYAMGVAGGLALLILAVLGLARGGRVPRETTGQAATAKWETPAEGGEAETSLSRIVPNLVTASAPPAEPARPAAATADVLKIAADLCTEFGRLQDSGELKALLGRAARVMEASGLVVWLGGARGEDLQPVLAHGYGDQVLALMRPVPRTADNAAAAAYRTGELQVVGSHPGRSLGAVVAPLLSADGCIGALTAELRGQGEQSEQVQALASIFAAQLASVLGASVSSTAATVPRSAAG